ncbi:WD40 repeat domain-containing protein [Actinoplanes couchii]|nr:hypothetical protein [Actinoplanes couchii]MDR6319316.1 WD40 repeat protein [Actinoplanes couchii]
MARTTRTIIGTAVASALVCTSGAVAVAAVTGFTDTAPERERSCDTPDTTVPATTGTTTAWVLTPDGQQALNHDTMTLYDTQTGTPVRTLGATSTTTPRFTPSGQLMVTTTDQAIVLTDPRTAATVQTIPATATATALSPDGTLLATSDGTVHLWDVRTGRQIHELPTPARTLTFSPDGTRLATGGDSDQLRTWHTTDWSLDQEFSVSGEGIDTLAYSPDGLHLATIDADGQTRAVDLTTQESTRIEYFDRARDVAFTPDSARLIITMGWSSVVRADPATGYPESDVEACDQPGTALPAPDGESILVITGTGFDTYRLP